MSWPKSHTHVLIHGGTLVTMDGARQVMEADLLISEGKIAAIGKDLELPPATRLVNAKGQTVLPGFIQGHTHLGQTLFRGLAEGRRLMPWLEECIWPLEAAHNEQSAYWSGMLGAADCLLSGTTTLNDIGLVHGTGALAQAVMDSGIRAILGHCLMDTGDTVPPGLRLSTGQAAKLAEEVTWFPDSGRLEPSLCPRFILSCSRGLWEVCVDIHNRRGFPIHTHLLESPEEGRLVQAALGQSQMEYLDVLGVLDTNLRIAHGVWLDPKQIAILGERSMSVIHCPSANLKLGSGVADIRFLDSVPGIALGIGCDGTPCNNTLDILAEMRLTGLLQSQKHGPGIFSTQRIVELATIEGARALGKDKQLGSLEVGKMGDVTVLDLDRPQSLAGDAADVYDVIVYSASRDQVTWVLVDGEIVVDHGELPLVDMEQVLLCSRQELGNLLERSAV